MSAQSSYFFTSSSPKEILSSAAGSMHAMTANELPGLGQMSFVDLTLKQNGVMNPMWHPGAQKIGYCTQGRLLVSVHCPGQSEAFSVGQGDIFYIPQGCVHHVENLSDVDGVIKFALNHGDPETMTLSRSVHATSDAALEATFSTGSDVFAKLKGSMSHELLGVRSQSPPAGGAMAHRYKFNIEESDKVIQASGGYLLVGLKVNLTALNGVGILGFGLNPGGAVEPHWHPNSDELVYVTKGTIRAMLLSPDGHVETKELGPGEGFYAPASYFHSIENIGQEEMDAIAFFNNPEMEYIGLGEAVGSFSNEVLASAFNVKQGDLAAIPKDTGPLVIVPM